MASDTSGDVVLNINDSHLIESHAVHEAVVAVRKPRKALGALGGGELEQA